jgi:hypothetical protein
MKSLVGSPWRPAVRLEYYPLSSVVKRVFEEDELPRHGDVVPVRAVTK